MKLIKHFKAPLIIAAAFLALSLWLPAVGSRSAVVVSSYLKEMILIIPPVFVLMGLLEVWVPRQKIQRLLGQNSGAKGILLSFALGTFSAGPLYIAFPLAASLQQKGARVSNVVIFLGAWAAVKLPQLILEMQFLGFSFTALRFILTVTSVILIGLFMEKVLRVREPLPQGPVTDTTR